MEVILHGVAALPLKQTLAGVCTFKVPGNNGNLKITADTSFKNALYTALQKALKSSVEKKVLFIDCANAFDPYVILKLSKNRLDAKRALENILI